MIRKLKKSIALLLAASTILSTSPIFANEVTSNEVKEEVNVDTRITEPVVNRDRYLLGWNADDKRKIEKFTDESFPLLPEPILLYQGKKIEYPGELKPHNFFEGMMFPLKTTLDLVGVKYTESDGDLIFTNMNGIKVTVPMDLTYPDKSLYTCVRDGETLERPLIYRYTHNDIYVNAMNLHDMLDARGIRQIANVERWVAFATPTDDKVQDYKTMRANFDNTFTPEYYLQSGLTLDESKKYFKEKALEITKGISGDREKAKAIYDYVISHIEYPDLQKGFKPETIAIYDKYPELDSVYASLLSGEGTCGHFADATNELLKAAGIPARLAGNFGYHFWSEAYVDGDWIIIDSTWKEFDMSIEARVSKCTLNGLYRNYGTALESSKNPNDTDDSTIYWKWYWKQPFAPQLSF